ncbi:COPI associated protein [Nitzschia inconspicua]|uniref:COPI associated protein n=1 Tax=Nitzschia inconspicua TaxID=303405 RepID=A0A9K3PES6_9STRA|nr:COPI associated protein [Nitzschia inconspicua]
MSSSPPSQTESAPLISSSQAQVAAAAGVSVINEASSKIKKATQDGPLTFRILGFIGGIAMIVSNGLGIVDRFMSFNFTGSLVAIYGCLFGIMITLLEMPSIYCCKSGNAHASIRYYCRFLEYTWGRGVFFFFVGSLQVTNFNMLDWVVGGFMMFVGFTAIIAGMAAAKNLRLLRFSIKSEEDLKKKWDQYDADGNGAMDVKELSAFVRDSGINMTTNEIASTYMTLDKNFDDQLTYEEFYMWWKSHDDGHGGNEYSV